MEEGGQHGSKPESGLVRIREYERGHQDGDWGDGGAQDGTSDEEMTGKREWTCVIRCDEAKMAGWERLLVMGSFDREIHSF